MASDYNEATKAHWGIRWETVRIRLGEYWDMPDVVAHAKYNLAHWQQCQENLSDQAQKESLL